MDVIYGLFMIFCMAMNAIIYPNGWSITVAALMAANICVEIGKQITRRSMG